ncbi:MAG: hypothetical protein GY810_10820 [Aureispira sp.]|nr:hypothetical protein [Aureispira sp.]
MTSKIYVALATLSMYLFPLGEQISFPTPELKIFKEEAKTYWVIPEKYLDDMPLGISIIPYPQAKMMADGLVWGPHTHPIQQRVDQLRIESPMLDQMLCHLEHSEYPFLVVCKNLEKAIGQYLPNRGELQFALNQMDGYFFDAAIIEEFVHAYQGLYYNYTHGSYRSNRHKVALKKGNDYSTDLKKGMQHWKKYGEYNAFIESEAKLITYIIQNQSNSISLQDIVDTDDYNTGGEGRNLIQQYLVKQNDKHSCRRLTKLGVLDNNHIDLKTFMRYQTKFIKHWSKKAPKSQYTKGQLKHAPDALNSISKEISDS